MTAIVIPAPDPLRYVISEIRRVRQSIARGDARGALAGLVAANRLHALEGAVDAVKGRRVRMAWQALGRILARLEREFWGAFTPSREGAA